SVTATSTITGASETGNTVTVTTSTAPVFPVGDMVNITGVGSGYNGTFAISAETSTGFSYTTIQTGLATLTGLSGTATGTGIGTGNAFNITVTALDAYGNVATGYNGTVQFSSSDSAATLPTSSTLTN